MSVPYLMFLWINRNDTGTNLDALFEARNELKATKLHHKH